jgi:hypothetical protein
LPLDALRRRTRLGVIDTSHTILFTGYFERRIRGEMLAYQLNPGQTRQP